VYNIGYKSFFVNEAPITGKTPQVKPGAKKPGSSKIPSVTDKGTTAAKDASKRKLKHIGYGMYADASGKPVAKSVKKGNDRVLQPIAQKKSNASLKNKAPATGQVKAANVAPGTTNKQPRKVAAVPGKAPSGNHPLDKILSAEARIIMSGTGKPPGNWSSTIFELVGPSIAALSIRRDITDEVLMAQLTDYIDKLPPKIRSGLSAEDQKKPARLAKRLVNSIALDKRKITSVISERKIATATVMNFSASEYGKQKMLQQTASMSRILNANGEQLSNEDVQSFIKDAGAGDNPSDYFYLIKDEDTGDAVMMLVSSKQSTADMTGNSSPVQSYRVAERRVDDLKKNNDISEKEHAYLTNLISEYSTPTDSVTQLKHAYAKTIAENPRKFIGLGKLDPKAFSKLIAASTALSPSEKKNMLSYRQQILDRMAGKNRKDGKAGPPFKSWGEFVKFANEHPDKLTNDEYAYMYRSMRVLKYQTTQAGKGIRNSELERINEFRDKANRVKTKSGYPVGDMLLTMRMLEGIHYQHVLTDFPENTSGTMAHLAKDSFYTNAGGKDINAKTLESCIGVTSFDKFMKNLQVERLETKDDEGNVTGERYISFVQVNSNTRFNVGELSLRTKGGTKLQEAYRYGSDLRKCLDKT
jgi:hypothetical protein